MLRALVRPLRPFEDWPHQLFSTEKDITIDTNIDIVIPMTLSAMVEKITLGGSHLREGGRGHKKCVLVSYLIKGAGRLSSSTTVMRVGARPLGVRTGGAENT